MTEHIGAPLPFIELHCHSFYSLLDGASSPEALVSEAARLGMPALALTDHDSLAGAMRFWTAARRHGIRSLFGAEVTLRDGAHLTLLAENQHGYANLCRLITRSRMDPRTDAPNEAWAGKVAPELTLEHLTEHRKGLIALSGCERGLLGPALRRSDAAEATARAGVLADIFGAQHFYLELQHHERAGDDTRVRVLLDVAGRARLPVVATGNTHYAVRAHARLRDCLIAIDRNESLDEARRAGALPYNHTYALADAAALTRRFAGIPHALANTLAIAERCFVDLDFGGVAGGAQRMPAFPVPAGQTEFGFLYNLCHAALPMRYPRLEPRVITQLAHELQIIQDAHLSSFFLLVWDVVRFARERRIRCSGRGSAAGSIVAYLLDISQVDPLEHDLLFERFLSPDKATMPDIDLDFDWRRREEVIQYLYERYGRTHCAMVCNHVQFQARSALRDLGRALNFPEAVVERLLRHIDAHSPAGAADEIDALRNTAGDDMHRPNEPLALLCELLRSIDGVVRHLSIHVGGMLITGRPLDELVPIEPATMPGRCVVQWDKDSIEDAGLVKLDVLSLRTHGLIAEAQALLEQGGDSIDLDRLPVDDPCVYDMMCAADTLGAFQIESRAQMQMLPRTQPRNLKDLAVEIAIVRPGPIQGGAVHPYVDRRIGKEDVRYDHPDLETILRGTLGVLLYQEDCLRIAMTIAGFSGGEADQLRRAMSRSRSQEAMAEMHDLFVRRALTRGYDLETASVIFTKIAGFAQFGFCRSHAASFARISYVTCWLKKYHPAAFYTALLNSGAGFYTHEIIAADMHRHGIELLPLDVTESRWEYTRIDDGRVRMGASTIGGLGAAAWARVEAARPFHGLRDFHARARLPKPLVEDMIRAGMFDAYGERRALLWEMGALPTTPAQDELPLETPITTVALPLLTQPEAESWEHEVSGLAPGGSFVRHFRTQLQQLGVVTLAQARTMPAGRRVRVAGMIYVRQRPQTAKGVTFLGVQDETALMDWVVKAEQWKQFRLLLRGEHLLIAEGIVQAGGGAASLLVQSLEPGF
jgi:error-prone DNA polymerase